jgi:VanZ family protein
MQKEKRGFRIWLTLTILFMGVIYFISNTPYEKQDIKPILEKKVEINENILPDIQLDYDEQRVSSANPYDFIEFLFRKAGHIIGYFVLTLLWLKTLTYTRFSFTIRLLLSSILSLGYAALDEFHQTFVPGRTGHVIDVVAVDLIGVILAILLSTVTRFICKAKSLN